MEAGSGSSSRKAARAGAGTGSALDLPPFQLLGLCQKWLYSVLILELVLELALKVVLALELVVKRALCLALVLQEEKGLTHEHLSMCLCKTRKRSSTGQRSPSARIHPKASSSPVPRMREYQINVSSSFPCFLIV